jgi:hypothetical protein
MATGTMSARHDNIAFLVEALVLLVVLMASLAVFTNLFASAQREGRHSARTTHAIILATNAAEAFSADPQVGEVTSSSDGLRVSCHAQAEPAGPGKMYRAEVTVVEEDTGETLYTIETARYVRGDA